MGRTEEGAYKGWLTNTGILSAAGLSGDFSHVQPHHLEAAKIVGDAVARATYLLDRNRPWRKQFDWVNGYIEGWMAFKRDFKFSPIYREQRFGDPSRRITTKPDAYGPSRYGYITVQIKTCQVKDWVGLQLGFEEYAIVKGSGLDSSSRRFGVELKADGSYKPKRFDKPENRNDLRVFLAAYQYVKSDGQDEQAAETLRQWKARHK